MRPPLPALIPALLAVAALAGCAQVRSHQGYVIDADLVNSVQPGVDNKQSVLQTLGHPSYTSEFNGGTWYYISRDSRNYAFRNPRVRSQITLQVSFDPQGNVAAIRRGGLEQVAAISPDSHTTPTLGRHRTFFQDLFGNIGTVGAAGGGGGADSGTGGGGRDTP